MNRSRLLIHTRWHGSFLAIFFAAVIPVLAHPDLIDQIAQVTAQIKTQGESAGLFEQRADLYRRHGQFELALMDIAAGERLETNSSALLLAKARIYSDAGMAQQALGTIRKFLQIESNNAEGLCLRARNEGRLGQHEEAIADYTASIKLCASPMLDMFLERARQQALVGRPADAVQGLDEAMSGSEPLPVLQMPAIEYDRQRGAFDSALHRVDGFINRYPVKEPWLTLRAEILEQAGRTDEARQTFQLVIKGIENYPTVRRDLDLTRQLGDRARHGLARTLTKPSVP